MILAEIVLEDRWMDGCVGPAKSWAWLTVADTAEEAATHACVWVFASAFLLLENNANWLVSDERVLLHARFTLCAESAGAELSPESYVLLPDPKRERAVQLTW